MKYPACFPSETIYAQWKLLAVIAEDMASPCTDCTPEFEHKMHSLARCAREKVIVDFLQTPKKKYKPKKKRPTGGRHD